MNEEQTKMHKKLAVDCFNKTWDLIDNADRTEAQEREMIHTAHASLYHWMQIGEPVNFARGEWQVSRVYSVLEIGESALLHGLASLDLCSANDIGDFDLAFGYEAVARAYSVLGFDDKVKEYKELALKAAEDIKDKGDKEYTLSEIGNIE